MKNLYRVVTEAERTAYGQGGSELVVPAKMQDIIAEYPQITDEGGLEFGDDRGSVVAAFASGYWISFQTVTRQLGPTATKREIKAGAWA